MIQFLIFILVLVLDLGALVCENSSNGLIRKKREMQCIIEVHQTDLAITKSSLTIREPSPIYFWTNSEPETLIKVQSVWCATALANNVFPVPGGPKSKTPYMILHKDASL